MLLINPKPYSILNECFHHVGCCCRCCFWRWCYWCCSNSILFRMLLLLKCTISAYSKPFQEQQTRQLEEKYKFFFIAFRSFFLQIRIRQFLGRSLIAIASTFIHSINANKIDTKLELMSQFPPLNYNCKSAKQRKLLEEKGVRMENYQKAVDEMKKCNFMHKMR